MTYRLLTGLLALAAGISALFWFREARVASSLQQDARQTAMLQDEEDSLQRASYADLLHELTRQSEQDDTKLSASNLIQIRSAMAFLDRRLRGPHPLESLPEVQIENQLLLTECAWLLRRFDRTRDSLQAALEIYQRESLLTLPENSHRGYIAAENALGCVLVNTGHIDEALPHFEQARKSCERWLDRTPDDLKLLQLLSRVTTNLGVTALIRREDGVDLIARGAEMARQSGFFGSADDDTDSLIVSELAADGFQAAGLIEFQHGRLDRTALFWKQALAETVHLQSLARLLAETVGFEVSATKYRRAHQSIADDLRLLEEFQQAQTSQPDSSHSRSVSSLESVPETSPVLTSPVPTSPVLTSPVLTSPVPASPMPASPMPVWNWVRLNEGRSLSLLPVQLAMRSRMPGEFEHQDAILFVWPDQGFGQATILSAIKAIQETTTCVIGIRDTMMEDDLGESLQQAGISQDNLRVVFLPTEVVWVRDFGPLSVIQEHGGSSLLDPIYWHDFSRPRVVADSVPRILGRTLREPVHRLPIQLDGGAILSNGDDVCLISKATLETNALLGQSEEFVTASIQRVTGAGQVIYLESLYEEPTQHIDMFATFVSKDTIVVEDYTGIDRENAKIVDRNAALLQSVQTRSGPLNVVRIPAPPREKTFFGGSYTNVLFANGVLLVPSWTAATKSTEKKVQDTYQRLLPGWKIVPINCSEIGQRGGALHCISASLTRLRSARRLTTSFGQGT